MSMLSNKDAKQFAKGSIDIELLSDEILSQHSLCFSTFEDAKATISTQKIEYCFDRISFCVYSHNLRPEDFSLLGKALTTKCEKKLNRENQKARLEYGALFHMMVLNGYCAGAKIVKETRPDFILENKHRKIGVEVTELTTPQDQVLYAISKQNFGKGKSIDEIKRDA